jgi:hypothetical protein
MIMKAQSRTYQSKTGSPRRVRGEGNVITWQAPTDTVQELVLYLSMHVPNLDHPKETPDVCLLRLDEKLG